MISGDALPAGITSPVPLSDYEALLKANYKARQQRYKKAAYVKPVKTLPALTWNPARKWYRSKDERASFKSSWIRMVTLADRLKQYCQSVAGVFKMRGSVTYTRHRFDVLVDQVCKKHKVTKRDIKSDCRELRCVNPRREISYRAKYDLSMSLSDIGRRMGGRDHTTILNNIRNWDRLLKIKNANGKLDHLKKHGDYNFNWDLVE